MISHGGHLYGTHAPSEWGMYINIDADILYLSPHKQQLINFQLQLLWEWNMTRTFPINSEKNIDNKINNSNKHLLRSTTKGYDGKTH